MSLFNQNFSHRDNAREINNGLEPADRRLYVTYGLIAINILVFILMVMDGAGLIIPDNNLVYLKWGSDFGPLTLSGDYWRLVTNIFIHFGIIHLLMNMYCLYIIGGYLEPMLGRVKFIAAYFCTGILASLTSLWWHSEPVNSAGASGAIFGMYGLFLSLLTTNIIPVSVRKGLLQNIGIFIVYNLVYGAKSGVDNSAHVGGLVSGFVIGYLYVINFRAENKGTKAAWVLPAVIGLTLAAAVFFLDQNKVSAGARTSVLTEIKEGAHKDTETFTDKYNEFVVAQDAALAPLKADALLNDTLKQQLTDISLPEWDKAESIGKELQQLDAGENAHKKAGLVLQYVSLRREEVADIIAMINKEPGAEEKHDSIIVKLNSITGQLR